MRVAWIVICLFLVGCGGSSSGDSGGGSDPGDGGDNGSNMPGTPAPDPDVRLNSSPAGSALSLFPAMVSNGQKLFVTWYDQRNGELDVFFNRSLDGGDTWLSSDIRLDSGSAGTAGSLLPQICTGGNAVYVAWHDRRNGKDDVYFNRSLDNGATWLASDIRINTNSPGGSNSRNVSLCCDGVRVYIAWQDDRSGTWDIYASRSLDNGATWLGSDLRVDGDTTSASQRFPALGCNGNNVFCTWNDTRSGGTGIRIKRSLDGGASWETTETVLDDADAAGIPRIAVSGQNIHVVWGDVRSDFPEIRYNRSTNTGVDWLASDIRVDNSTGGATNPSIDASENDFYVAWQDTRDGEADVYVQRTRDFGATWLTNDARMDLDPAGLSASWAPSICAMQQDVHVVWMDDRNGSFDIFSRYSGDRAETWSSPEIRMDTNAAGSAQSVAPAAACLGTRVGVCYMDGRNSDGGEADIYFNRMGYPIDG